MLNFGERVVKQMENNNVSKKDMLLVLGINSSQLRNWVEDDQLPNSKTLLKVLAFFGKDLNYFVEKEFTEIRRKIYKHKKLYYKS